MKKNYIKQMFIKRYFDTNWNSYFNYYFIDTKWNRIDSTNKENYWYWNNVISYIMNKNNAPKLNFTKDFKEIDLWYWLKREMINL